MASSPGARRAAGVVTEQSGEHDDAVVVVAEAELALGADHAVGDVAVGLARGDVEAPGQHGAGQDDDDEVADSKLCAPQTISCGLPR